ncbi:EAL domain-containing protein [Nitrincola alkalilacustris]|uniref:EAL domain-containing protein n=1 Tax=Nitrincola alkalilacustris TaxID=1571224 RepID=UPI00124E9CD9|nr:EAL domain-containing protein [Nitrincola alkalilacustris]
MPLTYVVNHLNRLLEEIHPESKLHQVSELRFQDGKISAAIGELHLYPHQVPVFDVRTARIVAYDTALLIRNPAGEEIKPSLLYLQTWDAADIVFLDRFLRSLHALHHISLEHEKPGLLILDVHLRHISAVPNQHGQVFEQLLSALGLSPQDIVLRHEVDRSSISEHAIQAINSFSSRGYTLLASLKDLDEESLLSIHSAGFNWAALDTLRPSHYSTTAHLMASTKLWQIKAHALGLQTLTSTLSTNDDLNLALNTGFTMIAGRLLSPDIPHKAEYMSVIGKLLQNRLLTNPDVSLGV